MAAGIEEWQAPRAPRARLCDAPLLPCLFLRNPDGSYRGVLGELARASRHRSPDEDARRMMAAVAAAVEAAVRQAPDQWFNFYRCWDNPSGTPP